MSDRLDRAHALRAAIHTWLKDHPHARMAAIIAAFPDVPAVTVRKSVQRLAGLGSVVRRGASTATTYTALGDEIYRPETMRQAMRTGHANLLHAYSRDRIAQAWALRQAIHSFICAHSMMPMSAIVAAFPDTPGATIRKHVKALVSKENVLMHGRSIAACYSASTSAIYDPESVREKLRSNGRSVGNLNRHDALDEQGAVPQDVPGKYVNRPDMHHPHPYQGGQFDRSGRLNGMSLLAMAG